MCASRARSISSSREEKSCVLV
uniref:Uncharacterized protein n=1 Tax=Arundo donax TaxID=35708 RepID=A0A0A9FGJ6_ARUDO